MDLTSEFDSPEVAREFPGLYKPDNPVEMSDPSVDEESDKKKKKDKKDSKKDKGYATLADENSHEEEDGDSHQGKKRLKGFLSSGKKKDKDEKEPKKDKKLEKEKSKKSDSSTERKSLDRDVPFSSVRIPFSAERHRDINLHRSSIPVAFFSSLSPKGKDKSESGESPAAATQGEKEKSSTSGLNAFLNAPAPMFLQKKKDKDKEHKKIKEPKKDKEQKKEKEHKDKKEHASGVAKVKLKLMRSKNSLEDPHEKELHVSVSHQFPEDPDSLSKEIRKYEQLLEQTHAQIKASKKVSKKQEEQLWELQRTLTALKRKLRSINALSTASSNIHLPASGPSSVQNDLPANVSTAPPTNLKSTLNNTIPIPPPGEIEENATVSETKLVEKGCEEVSKCSQLSPDLEELSPVPYKIERCSDPVSEILSQSSCEPVVKKSDDEITPSITAPPPPRKSARRSLDFSNIVVDNKKESRIPASASQENLESLSDNDSPVPFEHEKVQVHVHVHNESKDDEDEDYSSGARSDESGEDEALPSISSRPEENIGPVVDDVNAMIGSMHEELEAAAFVFGQKIQTLDVIKKNLTNVSKSEPTFGEQANDSSDIELIRDGDDEDEEDDLQESFIEELIPELLNLPEFETPEYLTYENEQLGLFNKLIQEEIVKEEAELGILTDELNNVNTNGTIESDDITEDYDMDELLGVWNAEKSENESLHANVSRLRQLVALSRLEEFKLETRLHFLEDKILPISPITTTTPLHSET